MMLLVHFIRKAIEANGGTPLSFTPVGALRELVAAYGGEPTKYDRIGLWREAIEAAGGDPVQFNERGLIQELVALLGQEPDNRWWELLVQLAESVAAHLPGTINDLSVLSTTTSTIALAFTDAAHATSHEYQLNGGGWAALDPSKVIDSLPPDTSFDVRVRGVNAEGNGPPSNTVQAQTQPIPIPVNTAVPAITGIEHVGEELTATTGTWTNSPTGYAYQWQRNTGSWADIAGATSSTYVLQTEDEGLAVRVSVVATNAGGDSEPAYSEPTDPIAPAIPDLGVLLLSEDVITEDDPVTIDILGATAGSTITVQSGVLPNGLTLNSGARTISGTPTVVDEFSFTLRETLAGSSNSPRDNNLSIEVEAVEPPIEADFYMVDGGTGDGLTPETAGDFATVWTAATDGDVIALVGNTTVPKAHIFNKSVTITCARGAPDADPLGTGHPHIARFQRLYDLIAVPPNDPNTGNITALWRITEGTTVEFGPVRCRFPYWPGEGQEWPEIGVREGTAWIGPGGLSGGDRKVIFRGTEISHGYGPDQIPYDPTFDYPEYTAEYNTAWRAPYVIGGRVTGQFLEGTYIHDVKEISKIVAQADSENIFDQFWFERVIGDFIRIQWDDEVTQVDEPVVVTRGIMLDPMGLETDTGNPHSDWWQTYMTRITEGPSDLSILRYQISANVMVGVTHPNTRGLAQTHFFMTSQDHQVVRYAILIGSTIRNFAAIGATYKAFSQDGMRDTYIRNSIFVNPDWWESAAQPHRSDIVLDRIYPAVGEPRVSFDDSRSLVWDTIAEGISGNASYTSNMIDTGYKGADISHIDIFEDPSDPEGFIKPGVLYAKYRPKGIAEGSGPDYETLHEMLTDDIDFTGEKPWIGLIALSQQTPSTLVTSNRFYLFGGELGDEVTIALPPGVEMQQYPPGEDTVLEAWTDTPTAVVGRDAQLRTTTPASGNDIHEIEYGGDVFEWFVGLGVPDAPAEFLVSEGGHFRDTANLPAETTHLRFEAKVRLLDLPGTRVLFGMSGTWCNLEYLGNGTFRANVRDSENTLVISSTVFTGATVTQGSWMNLAFDVMFEERNSAILTLNGVDYTINFSTEGSGVFPSNRVLLVGSSSAAGAAQPPAGTEFADIKIYRNDTLHKEISNDADVANADLWKQPASPTSDFTQGIA